MAFFSRLISWAQRNERHLGAVLFVFGFATDLITFAFLPVTFVNLAFLAYLALAALATLGSHLFAADRTSPHIWRRTLSIVFPLAAQYAIGSLLSGCLIFYTKSAAIIVSWPFLLLIAFVFIGNEYFRTYYKYLAFQVVLLFFAIYAYALFAFPLLLHRLGPPVFAASTIVSLAVFTLFLLLLHKVSNAGFTRSLRYIIPSTAFIVVLVVVSYFSGLIPPIPLTLPQAGIYQGLRHEGPDYILATEHIRQWWEIGTQTIQHVPGTPLYAFSSVSAPIAFGTSIVHVWERYDLVTKKWVSHSRIQFPISGGRDGGYRGYSQVVPEEGKWRVSIETADGQIIGRLYFMVVPADVPPVLVEVVR